MTKDFNPEDYLRPEAMLSLYSAGAFPMASGKDAEDVDWYLPEERTIIPLDKFNIPRSLKKFMKSHPFEIAFDRDPEKVILNCQQRDETWISDKLIEGYRNLINLGHLHSVETYLNGELVGGLYGISVKGAFFGESMFSKVSQASKTALISLINRLREHNFTLLDVQYPTEHLSMFGTVQISLDEYHEMLETAYKQDRIF